jgi:hypothetical protein
VSKKYIYNPTFFCSSFNSNPKCLIHSCKLDSVFFFTGGDGLRSSCHESTSAMSSSSSSGSIYDWTVLAAARRGRLRPRKDDDDADADGAEDEVTPNKDEATTGLLPYTKTWTSADFSIVVPSANWKTDQDRSVLMLVLFHSPPADCLDT